MFVYLLYVQKVCEDICSIQLNYQEVDNLYFSENNDCLMHLRSKQISIKNYDMLSL